MPTYKKRNSSFFKNKKRKTTKKGDMATYDPVTRYFTVSKYVEAPSALCSKHSCVNIANIDVQLRGKQHGECCCWRFKHLRYTETKDMTLPLQEKWNLPFAYQHGIMRLLKILTPRALRSKNYMLLCKTKEIVKTPIAQLQLELDVLGT